ncbi:hypothetical protein HZC09_01785 [Candidatus Micrarchaeota archaeon]|nr:hypothetical protein [Candidatus Micrarchaeota archaeon]
MLREELLEATRSDKKLLAFANSMPLRQAAPFGKLSAAVGHALAERGLLAGERLRVMLEPHETRAYAHLTRAVSHALAEHVASEFLEAGPFRDALAAATRMYASPEREKSDAEREYYRCLRLASTSRQREASSALNSLGILRAEAGRAQHGDAVGRVFSDAFTHLDIVLKLYAKRVPKNNHQ